MTISRRLSISASCLAGSSILLHLAHDPAASGCVALVALLIACVALDIAIAESESHTVNNKP
jgi:hypothetical protein